MKFDSHLRIAFASLQVPVSTLSVNDARNKTTLEWKHNTRNAFTLPFGPPSEKNQMCVCAPGFFQEKQKT